MEEYSRPILTRIDAWEKESIERIRNAAKTARGDLQQWIDEIKRELEGPCQKLAEEMQKSRQVQDYTEIELKRWTQQLKEFHRELERQPMMEYFDDEERKNSQSSGIIRLIKFTQQPDGNQSMETNDLSILSDTQVGSLLESDMIEREKFGEVLGTITVSDGDLLATYAGPWNGNASVCGINLYSSGIHHLHFRIVEKFYDSPFFGIITASQAMTERIFECPSINGWKNFDFRVINGLHERDGRDRIVHSGDDVTLTLDCERRQLFFRHRRTDRLLHLPIDLRSCPFPWKSIVILRRRDDCVRLLGGTVSYMTMDLLAKLHNQVETWRGSVLVVIKHSQITSLFECESSRLMEGRESWVNQTLNKE